MKLQLSQLQRRIVAILMVVFVISTNLPLTAFAAAPTVDVQVNGSSGPVTLAAGQSFTYTWTSTDATACQQTSPTTSVVGLSGSSATIDPSHAFYPSTSTPTTITITCTDGTTSVSDTVVVSLGSAPATTPSVDVTANGSNGPITLNSGDTFTYDWTSTNSTACQQTSPTATGVSLSGTSGIIDSSHAFYPGTSTPTTITITCTDGTNTATDSVVINLGSVVGSTTPTVDVKANGSDGPVTLNSGDTFTYDWTSTNATACQQISPTTTGISLSGTSGVIDSSHAFYPSTSTPTTITIVCTDGTNTATDSVVINLGSVVGSTTPTVDVKANGSDGPVVINNGDTFVYTWTSTNSTACQQTSPTTTGVSLSGSSAAIGTGHPFYPSLSTPTVITVVCTDGTNTATDSVTISLTGGSASVPTVDVKANGSDGPVIITQGDSYTYTWVSANATACQQTTPTVSGTTLSGASGPISPGHPFYPSLNSPTTITFVCTDGVNTATDSVVINLQSPSSSGGSHHHRSSSGSVTPGTVELSCPLIHDYMRIDFANDPVEVMKLQAFLKSYMGYTYVNVNGVFDQATYTAVGQFQLAYRSEILTPWGHTAPTHYVYILTLKKVNEIICQHQMPLTPDQQHEIVAFRNLLYTTGVASGPSGYAPTKKLAAAEHDYGLKDGKVVAVKDTPTSIATATTTSSVTSLASGSTSTPQTIGSVGADKGQNIHNLTSALFTFPSGVKETLQIIYEFILILIVLYIAGVVLKDVLYSDLPENVYKRFIAKWATIVLGLLIAIAVAYLVGEYALILPLLIVLIASTIWLALYNRHSKLETVYVKTAPQKKTS